MEKDHSKEAKQRTSIEYELKLVRKKLEALEELHKKCELEKTTLRDEMMKRSGNKDEGYQTLEITVAKEKQELEYQLKEVKWTLR